MAMLYLGTILAITVWEGRPSAHATRQVCLPCIDGAPDKPTRALMIAGSCTTMNSFASLLLGCVGPSRDTSYAHFLCGPRGHPGVGFDMGVIV